jgi:tetratricopeptide (TPR) repeat protein
MRGERDFAPFRPLRPDGKPAEVAGYFMRGNDLNIIGLYGQDEPGETRRVIFHEGVHWYLDAFPDQLPLWLEEGLAELFSTFEIKKDHALWGEVILPHVYTLNEQKSPSLLRLLGISRSDGEFNDSNRVTLVYAQSWALTHFMLFAKQEGTETRLGRFLRARAENPNPYLALEKAFGTDIANIEASLSKYVTDGGKFYLKKVPLATVTDEIVSFNTVTQQELNLALGLMALGANRLDETARRLQSALKSGPPSIDFYNLLARKAFNAKDYAGVVAAVDNAAAIGPIPPELSLLGVAAILFDHEDRHIGGPEARRLSDQVQKAIQQRPFSKWGFHLLTQLTAELSDARPADQKYLEIGYKLFPDEPGFLVGAARIALLLKRTSDAEAHLKQALEFKKEMPKNLVKYAEAQLRFIKRGSLLAAMQRASDEGDWEEALRQLIAIESLAQNPSEFSQSATLRKQFEAARERAPKESIQIIEVPNSH